MTTKMEPRIVNIKMRNKQWLEVMVVEMEEGSDKPSNAQSIPAVFDTVERVESYVSVLQEALSKPVVNLKLEDPQLH